MQISLTITDGQITADEHRMLRAIVDTLATRTPEVRNELRTVQKILHEDRPDVGLPIDTANLRGIAPGVIEVQPDAAAIFGGQTPSAIPLPPSAPIALIAPIAPIDAPVPTDAPNPQPPKFDARGLPWDARIHSGTKALIADGTWRMKRGINDPDLVLRVEAELRAIMAAPPAAFISPEAAMVGLPVAAAIPQPPVATVHPIDFAGLMQKATQLMAAQKLSREELEQCAQAVGLPSIVGAVTRVDLVPTISAHIDTLVATKG